MLLPLFKLMSITKEIPYLYLTDVKKNYVYDYIKWCDKSWQPFCIKIILCL